MKILLCFMMMLTGYIFINNNAVKFCTTTYGACVVGSLCATQFYGDGSNLTGINAGFGADAQQNLYAGIMLVQHQMLIVQTLL